MEDREGIRRVRGAYFGRGAALRAAEQGADGEGAAGKAEEKSEGQADGKEEGQADGKEEGKETAKVVDAKFADPAKKAPEEKAEKKPAKKVEEKAPDVSALIADLGEKAKRVEELEARYEKREREARQEETWKFLSDAGITINRTLALKVAPDVDPSTAKGAKELKAFVSDPENAEIFQRRVSPMVAVKQTAEVVKGRLKDKPGRSRFASDSAIDGLAKGLFTPTGR